MKALVFAIAALAAVAGFGAGGSTAATQPWVKAQIVIAMHNLMESPQLAFAVNRIVDESKKANPTSPNVTGGATNLQLTAECAMGSEIAKFDYWCIDAQRAGQSVTNWFVNASKSPRFDLWCDSPIVTATNAVFGAVKVQTGEKFHQEMDGNAVWLVSDTDATRKFRIGYGFTYKAQYDACQFGR